VFDLAHDIACGPGQVAAELAKHFKHVVASDPNPEHTSVAKKRLESDGKDHVSYVVTLGEDIAQHTEPGSVDLITVGEAIALMDMPRFLDAASAVLKPGGTLALWF